MVSLRPHLANRKATGLKLFPALVLVVGVAVGTHPAAATDTNAVLDAWFAAQRNVQTWSADFTQIRHFKTLTQPLLTAGRLWFAAPADFRWELGVPAQTIALRRNGDMFLIYPRLKRAEHYALDASAPKEWRDSMALLNAGFPRNRVEFAAQFKVLSLVATNREWQLRLEPTSKFARQWMPELGLGLATNDYALTRTELVFMDGSSMRSEFTNAVMNPHPDTNLFRWEPPADFKVTTPLAK